MPPSVTPELPRVKGAIAKCIKYYKVRGSLQNGAFCNEPLISG